MTNGSANGHSGIHEVKPSAPPLSPSAPPSGKPVQVMSNTQAHESSSKLEFRVGRLPSPQVETVQPSAPPLNPRETAQEVDAGDARQTRPALQHVETGDALAPAPKSPSASHTQIFPGESTVPEPEPGPYRLYKSATNSSDAVSQIRESVAEAALTDMANATRRTRTSSRDPSISNPGMPAALRDQLQPAPQPTADKIAVKAPAPAPQLGAFTEAPPNYNSPSRGYQRSSGTVNNDGMQASQGFMPSGMARDSGASHGSTGHTYGAAGSQDAPVGTMGVSMRSAEMALFSAAAGTSPVLGLPLRQPQ